MLGRDYTEAGVSPSSSQPNPFVAAARSLSRASGEPSIRKTAAGAVEVPATSTPLQKAKAALVTSSGDWRPRGGPSRKLGQPPGCSRRSIPWEEGCVMEKILYWLVKWPWIAGVVVFLALAQLPLGPWYVSAWFVLGGTLLTFIIARAEKLRQALRAGTHGTTASFANGESPTNVVDGNTPGYLPLSFSSERFHWTWLEARFY
jgi:hypothetical protein